MADYTSLRELNLSAVAHRYGLPELSAEVLAGGAANSSFTVWDGNSKYVLTALDNHTFSSAERLSDLMSTLKLFRFPTCELVADTNGKKVTNFGGRPVVLKHWVEGRVEIPLPDILLSRVGVLMAQLHSLPTDIAGLPLGTRRLTPAHEKTIWDFEDREFGSWLTDRLAGVRDLRSSRQDAVIHGDLYADNIIIGSDDSLFIIDWETASLDDPMLDLGMAIIGLAVSGGRLSSERARDIIAGYASVCPIAAEDLSLLPQMVEHAALIIAFHRYARHNIRYPDSRYAGLYREMVDLVDSIHLIDLG
ncbi:phosphotransferase [Nocardia testacea]|uniref:phosphotransferase n=1 Tax=Nocardia testacea TaxID=248551 RepID=UPI003A8A8A67